jgi:hypothetical protein
VLSPTRTGTNTNPDGTKPALHGKAGARASRVRSWKVSVEGLGMSKRGYEYAQCAWVSRLGVKPNAIRLLHLRNRSETNTGPGFNFGPGGGARGCDFELRRAVRGIRTRRGESFMTAHDTCVCVCVCLSACVFLCVLPLNRELIFKNSKWREK